MNNDDPHILVVDDDDGIRNLVKQFLNENNFLVTTAINAEDAENKIKFIKFDLIVLDVMMPGKNGINFILDNKNIETPIILLTAKGEPDDRIEGLEVGADDYLPKPFEPRELTLRIKKILNRSRVKDIKRLIEFENLKIDLNMHYIHKNEIKHKINSTEKIILENMIRSPGEIFTRESIGKLINLNKERSVDVIITRLRKKIEDDPKNPKYLQTIRGEGYVLWIK